MTRYEEIEHKERLCFRAMMATLDDDGEHSRMSRIWQRKMEELHHKRRLMSIAQASKVIK